QPYPAQPAQPYPAQPAQPYPAQPGQPYPAQPGQPYPPQPTAPPPEEDEPHRGFFARFALGGGVANVRGSLPPKPGFKPIEDLNHTAPVLAMSGLLGGGGHDLAIAAELSFEHMLTRVKEPSRAGFKLFGLGVTGSYYFEQDWFFTAHLRWVTMIVFMPDIECFWQCIDGTSGPGLGLTVGKEWFGDGDGSVGIALQGNYAKLGGDPELTYGSLLALLTLTHF
ncbi:MAG TPA: hypothetical protein PLU22_24070, partial [Polyangiaceae bacterium]|nr:hypothetical protein [Polyangiaceae bacterium]